MIEVMNAVGAETKQSKDKKGISFRFFLKSMISRLCGFQIAGESCVAYV